MNVVGEFRLKNNVVVEVIFKIFRTFTTAMTVIDTKYLQLGPFFSWYPRNLLRRLDHI